MPDLQVALPVGALAFYVYDSLLLLFDNEVIFYKARDRWKSVQGSDLVLLGKRVAAPAFMAPWALVLRSSWSSRSDPAPDPTPEAEKMQAIGSTLMPVRILCTIMLSLLVVGLPAAAMVDAAPLAMLAVFAGYYLLVIASLVLLVLARKELTLDRKALLMLSIDALACAPFAVNLVRKVTMHILPVKDALAFSKAHCGKEADDQLRTLISQRVDHLLAGVGGRPEDFQLRSFAARLKAEAGG